MILAGDGGCVQLRRRSGVEMSGDVTFADIDEALDRFSFDEAEHNLLTGDRVLLSTTDPRGLAFIAPTWWEDNRVHHNATFFAHVNAMGGIRLYRTFADAINNDRRSAGKVVGFSGAPIAVEVEVRDMSYHPLGAVVSYSFSTDRGAVDVTALGDLFSEQFTAGTISGSGSFDCLFSIENDVCAVAGQQDREVTLVLPQILMRSELGGEFDAILPISGSHHGQTIFYEISGVITRSAISVRAGSAIELAVDFVTTGEFALRIGKSSGLILKEDYNRIQKEQDLGFLLTETD